MGSEFGVSDRTQIHHVQVPSGRGAGDGHTPGIKEMGWGEQPRTEVMPFIQMERSFVRTQDD